MLLSFSVALSLVLWNILKINSIIINFEDSNVYRKSILKLTPASRIEFKMDCDGVENSDLNQLMNSFSSLQTEEKDDLVVGFQNIANELSYTTARFFLEMNNW